MTIEPMKAVSGLVVRPFGFEQQAILRQYPEQAIPPRMERRPGLILLQKMQLARSQAGLPHPYLTNGLGNLRILLRTPVRRAVALVIGLATQAHELASPANAKRWDLPLREDLPVRFFYNGYAVVVLQYPHYFEELHLLAHDFQLMRCSGVSGRLDSNIDLLLADRMEAT